MFYRTFPMPVAVLFACMICVAMLAYATDPGPCELEQLNMELQDLQTQLAVAVADLDILNYELECEENNLERFNSYLADTEAAIGIVSPGNGGGDFPQADLNPAELTPAELEQVQEQMILGGAIGLGSDLLEWWNARVAAIGEQDAFGEWNMMFQGLVNASNLYMDDINNAEAQILHLETDLIPTANAAISSLQTEIVNKEAEIAACSCGCLSCGGGC